MAIYIILFLLFFHLSYIDVKKKYILDSHVLLVGGFGIYVNGYHYLLSAGLLFILSVFFCLFYSRWRKKPMLGWGDVKLMTVSGLWLSLEILPHYLVCVGSMGVLWALLWQWYYREQKFPFSPALSIGFFFSLWQVIR